MFQKGGCMFEVFFKKKRIKKFAKKLPSKLKKLYGRQKYYTKENINHVIKQYIGNTSDVIYAYAMYCSPEEFKSINEEIGKNYDYDQMNADIFNMRFNSKPGLSRAGIFGNVGGGFDYGDGGFDFGGTSDGGDGG